ncbi:MAG TPA: sulfatase-like hydrolase/transferase, partial [Polyangiaceae bacterium]
MAATIGESERPNLLLLQTDQHRWDALGRVTPGLKTPNLDALAARGSHFTRAVCQVPMCMPSRYSMLLGLYPSQAGTRHNTQMIADHERAPAPFIAERLAAAGYATAAFGGTHFYEGEPFFEAGFPVRASRHGFETIVTNRRDGPGPADRVMSEEEPEITAVLAAERRGFGGGGEDPAGYAGRVSAVPGRLHPEAWLADRAMEWLNERKNDPRPWFGYVTLHAPHPGFNVPDGYEELYDLDAISDSPEPPWTAEPPGHARPAERWRGWWQGLDSRERRRCILRYRAVCSFSDAQLGRVLAHVTALGLEGNTLVVFVSDHGEMLGARGGRFSKYCLYDGAVRVPLILAGSGIGKRGEDRRAAELVDVVPTLLAAAGLNAPDLPGVDLRSDFVRAGTFAEMHGRGYERARHGPSYMLRTDRWKLILSWP